MEEDRINVFIRIAVSMASIGVAMGAGSWLAYEWVVEAEILAASQEQFVLPLLPLILLLVVCATAPVVAGILGIFEGLRGATLDGTAVAAGSCLIGGVLMVVLAAIFIGQIEPPSSGDGGAELMDVVSVGGLVGGLSAFSGSITTALTKQ